MDKEKELLNRQVKLISHYPDFLKDNKEFEAICEALDPEYNLILQRLKTTLDNIVPETANARGITRYEQWLELPTNPYLPLEQRRATVLAKLNEMYPFTEIKLQKMLAAIVGWGHFEYHRDGAYVSVDIDEEAMDALSPVYELLERLLPMNLHFGINQLHSVEQDRLVIGIGSIFTEIIETPIYDDIDTSEAYWKVGSIVTEFIETR